MKAIQVKYLPCTNHKPSRWKAWIEGGLSAVLSYDHALSPEGNARMAACALLNKMAPGPLIKGEGVLPNGDYVFTLER